MKFGSKKAIFGVIWGGFEVFGPFLGVSHPPHPHLGEISQKKPVYFFGSSPYSRIVFIFPLVVCARASQDIIASSSDIFLYRYLTILFDTSRSYDLKIKASDII